jgi:hypothetical protein
MGPGASETDRLPFPEVIRSGAATPVRLIVPLAVRRSSARSRGTCTVKSTPTPPSTGRGSGTSPRRMEPSVPNAMRMAPSSRWASAREAPVARIVARTATSGRSQASTAMLPLGVFTFSSPSPSAGKERSHGASTVIGWAKAVRSPLARVASAIRVSRAINGSLIGNLLAGRLALGNLYDVYRSPGFSTTGVRVASSQGVCYEPSRLGAMR